MERFAETVRDEATLAGVLAWAMSAADRIAAAERADDRDVFSEALAAA